MESISLQHLRIVEDQLRQIQEAIQNLELWNASLTDVEEDVVKNDLPALKDAINYLKEHLYEIVPFD